MKATSHVSFFWKEIIFKKDIFYILNFFSTAQSYFDVALAELKAIIVADRQTLGRQQQRYHRTISNLLNAQVEE